MWKENTQKYKYVVIKTNKTDKLELKKNIQKDRQTFKEGNSYNYNC